MKTLVYVAKLPRLRACPRHAIECTGKLILSLGVLLLISVIFLVGEAKSPRAADAQNATRSNWRLLRSANPKGGADAVSMSRTADTARSDLELAGMMLKCGEHGIEIVIVALTPLPPRARPEATISAMGKEWRFTASIVPPGAELLLPEDATRLAAGPWQSARELSVQVRSQQQSFGGVIPIDGLAGALTTLSANCPLR
jgi:hypothetical protein